MSLRINTNMSALGSQRAIARSSGRLQRNFERLSTGARINRAADDSAGLAISTRMGSRLRVMNQVIRNVNDGLSMTQVADTALRSSGDSVQRIRELAVQAASATMTSDDRFDLQVEVNQILDQMDLVSANTQFGGQAILDGGFNRFRLQVGDSANDVIDVNLKSIDTASLGRQARAEGFEVDTSTAIGSQEISLNGVFIRPTSIVDDDFSTADIEGSAIAKANAINDGTAFSGVSAEAIETYAIGDVAQGGVLDDAHFITINGETLSGFQVHLNDANGELVRQINAREAFTGVVAEKDEFNNMILRAPDGRNIEVFTSSDQVAAFTGLNGGAPGTQVIGGSLVLKSAQRINLTIHEFEGETALGLGETMGTHHYGLDEFNSLSTADVTLASEARRTIEMADIAIGELSGMRGDLGSILARLEVAVVTAESNRFSLTMAHSRINDTDLAREAVDMARNDIVRDAGISILSQANIGGEVSLGLLDHHTSAMDQSRSGFMTRFTGGGMTRGLSSGSLFKGVS